MKTLRHIALTLFVALFAMCSCDVVEEPYFQGNNDTISSGTKKVLLEDFTGVRCVNCPAAAVVASQLQELFGDKLIVMSVHAGFLANPLGPFPDFRTSEGTEWYGYFGFDTNPVGTVDRVSASGSYNINSAAWSDAVSSELLVKAVSTLIIEKTYDTATRALNVTVSGKLSEDQTDDCKLVVCLIESGIVGSQLTPSGLDSTYVHNHVFRGTLNGTWGESIGTAPYVAGTEFSKTYSTVLSSNYVADNCAIVAFLCRDTDKYVLQVEEKKIAE